MAALAGMVAPEKETPDQGGRAENQSQGNKSYRTGKRKAIEPVESFRLRWPQPAPGISKEQLFRLRKECIHTWKGVTMQLLHQHRYHPRMVVAVEDFLHLKDGRMMASNAEFARRCGYCEIKTISRDVAFFVSLGVFQTETTVTHVNGKVHTKRVIFLSVPANLSPAVVLSEDEDAGTTAGDTPLPRGGPTPYEKTSENKEKEGSASRDFLNQKSPPDGGTQTPQPPRSSSKSASASESQPSGEFLAHIEFLVGEDAIGESAVVRCMKQLDAPRAKAINFLASHWIKSHCSRLGFGDVSGISKSERAAIVRCLRENISQFENELSFAREETWIED